MSVQRRPTERYDADYDYAPVGNESYPWEGLVPSKYHEDVVALEWLDHFLGLRGHTRIGGIEEAKTLPNTGSQDLSTFQTTQKPALIAKAVEGTARTLNLETHVPTKSVGPLASSQSVPPPSTKMPEPTTIQAQHAGRTTPLPAPSETTSAAAADGDEDADEDSDELNDYVSPLELRQKVWKQFCPRVEPWAGCEPFEIPLLTHEAEVLATFDTVYNAHKYIAFTVVNITILPMTEGNEDAGWKLHVDFASGIELPPMSFERRLLADAWVMVLEWVSRVRDGGDPIGIDEFFEMLAKQSDTRTRFALEHHLNLVHLQPKNQ